MNQLVTPQAMDRPSRKTKTVNYCETKDFDDDDDFACAKAPPSKKAREDVKQEHKKPSSKSSSQEPNSQCAVSQKSRMPLDERLHERDLEAAITLSLLDPGDGIKHRSPTRENIHVLVDENTDPASLYRSNCSVDISVLGLDEITSEKAPSRQRKAAKAPEELRKKLEEDGDEDYEPKLTPDSESDQDFSDPAESEDEEFTVKKVSKTKKEKVVKNEKTKPPPAAKKASKPPNPKSQAAAAVTPVRSPPAAKAAATSAFSPSTASTSKPVFSLSPTGGRIPKWTPPGQIGKSPTSSQIPDVRSPGQGLRLGLSRRVRVKPLHPSVASH